MSLLRYPQRALWAALLALAASPSLAQTAAPLSLADAAALALQHQPQLAALAAEADAAEQRSIAAGERPDPSLSVGISDLTLQGSDRFTLHKESDTQFMVGVRQEFPRIEKLRLRRTMAAQEASSYRAERSATARSIARDARLAWLAVWKAEAAQRLTLANAAEADTQVQASTLALAANRANIAEVLAAKTEASRLRDVADGYQQAASHARNTLARWIGDAAFGPLSTELPSEPAPDAAALLAGLTQHPHFLAEAQKLAQAKTEVALAQQNYHPDWALSVGYGYRPNFADYGQLQVEIPLQIFPGNRQDRQHAAALAKQTAEQARLDDALREHRAEISLNAEDWTLLQSRLARYRSTLLPLAQARSAAALLAYGAGTSPLKDVLDARRMALELAMQQLELQTDAAMHLAQLSYFAP